jgi:hypothetical protein
LRLAAIYPTVQLLEGYEAAADKVTYLRSYPANALQLPPTKRLFAALALDNDLPGIAVALLGTLQEPTPGDLVVYAYANLLLDQPDVARASLGTSLKGFEHWSGATDRDLDLLVILLRELDPEGSLELLSQDQRSALEMERGVATSLVSASSLESWRLCEREPLSEASFASRD